MCLRFVFPRNLVAHDVLLWLIQFCYCPIVHTINLVSTGADPPAARLEAGGRWRSGEAGQDLQEQRHTRQQEQPAASPVQGHRYVNRV
jgi:hypothetical protein